MLEGPAPVVEFEGPLLEELRLKSTVPDPSRPPHTPRHTMTMQEVVMQQPQQKPDGKFALSSTQSLALRHPPKAPRSSGVQGPQQNVDLPAFEFAWIVAAAVSILACESVLGVPTDRGCSLTPAGPWPY